MPEISGKITKSLRISSVPLLIGLTVFLTTSYCDKAKGGGDQNLEASGSSAANVYVWDARNYGDAAPFTNKKIVVYRSSTCNCCKGWIAHLKKHGFAVEDHLSSNMTAVKKKFGIADQLASCHTAVVDGYLFEGHVPAQDIVRFLRSPPAGAAGLTVPAMPVGTPGMDFSARKDPFDVVLFKKSGQTQVYRKYVIY